MLTREFPKKLCIAHAVDGLRTGLSNFSGPSRVALIYSLSPEKELRVYDPQELLRGHELKLQDIFLNQKVHLQNRDLCFRDHFDWVHFHEIDLTGLLCKGGWSRDIFYQLWFTEHHPDMCSIGPTKMWLESAVTILAQDFSLSTQMTMGNSEILLQGFAVHAIRDYLLDRRNLILGPDTHLRVYPILEAVLAISKTREEGAWARGVLGFVDPEYTEVISYLVKFSPEHLPLLKNHKHARKMLSAVEGTTNVLVSDGVHLLGITDDVLPPGSLLAQFLANYGFLFLDDELVCSFGDGTFSSSTRKSKLVELEEILLEFRQTREQQDRLFKVIANLVHFAQERKFGCTLVIDFNAPPLDISGQYLEYPLDLEDNSVLSLVQALSRVDGALHIGIDLRLYAFACLLDGPRIPGEDRARGARYNSALRFTATRDNVIVVVVSSDRPVSVILGGIEISAACFWEDFVAPDSHPTLQEWLENSA